MTPQELWQSQQKEDVTMTLEQVRAHARRLERRVAWRNGREYAAAVPVIVVFGWAAWSLPSPLIRIASPLTIAAVAFVLWYLHEHGSAQALPPELGTTNAVEFLRGELVRQRDLLQTVWRWYLLPFVPGQAIFVVGAARGRPGPAWAAGYGFFAAAIFIGGHLLNRWSASRIQKRIERLDAYR